MVPASAPANKAVSEPKPDHRNEIHFIIVFSVINLHTFRRFSEVLYLAIYALTMLFVVNKFVAKKGRMTDGGLGIFAWIMVGVVGFVVSLVTISPFGAFTGLSRFLFAAPLFFAFVAFTDNIRQLRNHISYMVAFIAAAALTLPLQERFGAVDWFGEASVRAGFERYGSLVGAVSVIAAASGMYMVLSQESSLKVRWPFILAIALGASISLSKASLANVGLGLLALLWVDRRNISRGVFAIGVVGVIGFWLFSTSPTFAGRLNVVLQTVGFSPAEGVRVNSDINLDEAAWARLSELPATNVATLSELGSPWVYLLGGGYGFGGGALVPPDDVLAQQAHNQYVEFFTVFGLIGGMVLLAVALGTVFKLRGLYRTTGLQLYSTVLIAYLFLLGNAIFANGRLYQPATVSVFYLALFVAVSKPILSEAMQLKEAKSASP